MVELRLGRAAAPPLPSSPLVAFAAAAAEQLADEDPRLHDLLGAEHGGREENLVLRSPGSAPDPTVLACAAVAPYGLGSDVDIGPIERLAIARTRAAFGAEYVDVRPHSGIDARRTALDALTGPDDVVLDARLRGGRREGRNPSRHTVEFPLTAGDVLDHDGLAETARRLRPAVLLCGGEPHPLTPDFERLRAIADDVGALLVADISHIAGLVVTGLLPNPIDHAHVTTTCVATQLPGARGGLVLSGRDARTPVRGVPPAERLAEHASRDGRGEPDLAVIAGAARALDIATSDAFREEVARTALCAAELAAELTLLGHRVVTGGTDNNVVLVADVGPFAADALSEVDLLVGRMPGHVELDMTSAGRRGFGRGEARRIAQLVAETLDGVRAADDGYRLDHFTRLSVRDALLRLLWQFPLPHHVPTTRWRHTP